MSELWQSASRRREIERIILQSAEAARQSLSAAELKSLADTLAATLDVVQCAASEQKTALSPAPIIPLLLHDA